MKKEIEQNLNRLAEERAALEAAKQDLLLREARLNRLNAGIRNQQHQVEVRHSLVTCVLTVTAGSSS